MTDTTHSHRELELMDALRRLGGSARSAELAKSLDVSEETVRRVIKSLAKAGTVERVHGGAYLVGGAGDPSFFSRLAQHADEKRLIAKTLSKRIEDGMTVFLDVGSTTAFVAEKLRKHAGLTVVTNSVGVAQTLVSHNGNRVHFLGGEMKSDERGTFGSVTERHARRFAFDIAVLSVDALSEKRGFLFSKPVEAALSEVVSECADQVLIGLDHHKYSTQAPHCGVHPTRVKQVITDQAPEGAMATALSDWGIEVIVAKGNKS
ncbi:DeoR/GlpR family DNA-binding transcription regulator [Aliiroseovarius lamellibrachiae]|uniref:DeoR/GlpR family DNA-binding transcription regulator n=1 Tax=Aliiroseovarius lamellibrachiae TaxID=1924933 RepID=UPI0031B83BD9